MGITPWGTGTYGVEITPRNGGVYHPRHLFFDDGGSGPLLGSGDRFFVLSITRSLRDAARFLQRLVPPPLMGRFLAICAVQVGEAPMMRMTPEVGFAGSSPLCDFSKA